MKETDRLVSTWNCDSADLQAISIKAVMIMLALLLQKPSFKSKSKEHTLCLKRRLHLWQSGDFDALLRECRTIKTTLSTSKKCMSPAKLSKTFSNLMFQGKLMQHYVCWIKHSREVCYLLRMMSMKI